MRRDLFGDPPDGSRGDVMPMARSGDRALAQWFTPFWAAEELIDDALRSMGDVSVLEPSCGTGAFLAAVPDRMPAIGLDIDPRVVPAARANTGRSVILGDFRTHDLGGFMPEAIIGNPPFDMETVNAFLDRAHRLLPEDGLVAFVLPAYAFQTPSQVTRWMDMYSIDVNVIPRTLFPGLSKPLVWAKCIKSSVRRFAGMMLFSETRSVERMTDGMRRSLAGPGTWREAVRDALRSLGGEASVGSICDAIAPERRCGQHWRPKIRQTLQRGFVALGEGRWALPGSMTA